MARYRVVASGVTDADNFADDGSEVNGTHPFTLSVEVDADGYGSAEKIASAAIHKLYGFTTFDRTEILDD